MDMPNPYETARRKYRPKQIRRLLIAEAPPNAIERFFYFENVSNRDWLFLGLMQALYPDVKKRYLQENRTPKLKIQMLNQFKDDGYFLVDLSPEPIDQIPNGRRGLAHCVPGLIERINQLDCPQASIILIKANVYDIAFQPLRCAGYRVIDRRIPFPSSGQQLNFQIAFGEALSLADETEQNDRKENEKRS